MKLVGLKLPFVVATLADREAAFIATLDHESALELAAVALGHGERSGCPSCVFRKHRWGGAGGWKIPDL
jgi:hypothetical protein